MPSSHPPGPVDMVTPTEARTALGATDQELVDLVNDGRLAAYRLGPHLRFRHADVYALSAELVAA